MSKLSQTIKNYLEENNIGLEDIKDELKTIDTDLVGELLKDKENTYVIKKSGSVEKFAREKIERSIKNAAGDNKYDLNSSDLAIIVGDVIKALDSDPRKVYKTSEIKNYIKDALIKEGYSQVYKSFISYIKED
ncbi:ATP cone domain-containing protein [uncultured Anaerococcus sp.]|uniref:ATP cone domain-containing protein n=1 Tax=uncultured Anaerococcus sp. TaxID=293428 RepID=UPI00280AF5BD|nr:ATP cone domain-containing protein [uncultured Anaerococcus sp.]MDU5149116.1 ATP cone domain-containing protein [Anaerococcus prevotii]